MAKFCANCGKELIPGKPFCPDCGYSSNAAPEAPAHHLEPTDQFAMPGQVPEPEYQPRIHHLEAPEPQPPQNSAVPPKSYAPSSYQPTSHAQQAPAPQPQPQTPQNFKIPPDPFAPQPQPPALNIQQPDTQPPKEQPQKKTGCLDSPLLTVCNVIFAIIMAIELIVASLWYPGFFIRP